MSSSKGAPGSSTLRPRGDEGPPAGDPHLPAVAPLPPAVGKYEVLDVIGRGAMGVVYKCRQPGLDRPVAVKVLRAGSHGGEQQVRRFRREARAAARLVHPNVVQVYDFGTDGEVHYLVMEYVEGESLERLLARPGLTIEAALRLVYHVALALQAAHDSGIIHRDVKPSNILLTPSGRPKLADFGLAKPLSDAPGLSASGDLIGTPRYMSPEQVLAPPEDLDARTDVYSLGAVLYEMLTGRPPADGPNVIATLRRLADEEPVPVRELNPAVPEAVAAVCARAMAKDRDARFASAGELAEVIQTCLLERLFGRPEPALLLPLPGKPPAGRRLRWWGVRATAAAALAACAGLGVHAVLPPPAGPPPREAAGGDAREREAARAQLLGRGRELLRGLPGLPERRPGKRELTSLLEDLTAALKQPGGGDPELLLLRARVHRRLGECLAAVDDLEAVCRGDAPDPAALEERLLARYQFFVLYLGNLGEAALCPPAGRLVRDDVAALGRGGAARRRLAAAVAALAEPDPARAAAAAEALDPAGEPPERAPDLFMLRADAFARAADEALAAEQAAADEEGRRSARGRREELARRAAQALRQGLEAAPDHVGLLFLKANSFPRRAEWEADKDDDRAALLRRFRPAFETALDRLRGATLRAGGDTAVARSVLLGNYGRYDPALDQIKDAVSARPGMPQLLTYQAWLRLQDPTDGALTPEEVERALRELEPAFDVPPEDFNPYFVRALLDAAGGRLEAARKDLAQCRRACPAGALPTREEKYRDWVASAEAGGARYLDATIDLMGNLSVHVDLRIRASEELLRRLADPEAVRQDGLAEAEARRMKGWSHYRLAKFFAEKDDRKGVLAQAREALALRLDDLTPQTFRDDDQIKNWNGEEEFVKLYQEFEKK
jgi:predicted Ser/Thr protein kinase